MAETEQKVCQSCKASFTIEPDDFAFYKRVNVPPPTWCPRCRNIRRMAWREYQTLYRGNCDLCGKSIISTHHPDGPFTIYCRECWWSDKWDGLQYGRDYDFSKPFFRQFRELMEVVPRPALTGHNLVNSDYSHASQNCKNCYYVFWSYFSQDSQYGYGLLASKDVYDAYVADNSDHVYGSVSVNRMFRASFAYFSDDCLDSSFLYDCTGCSDCFGCVNLRKQKYCIWNEQLSKKEYQERLREWDLGSYAKLQEAKAKFREVYLSQPHRYAHIINSVDSTGDVIRDAKNCKECFTVLDGVENCKYVFGGGLKLKDSWDVTAGGDLAALLYESSAVTHSEHILFSDGCNNAHDIQYSCWSNFSDLFGCSSLRKKKYCILNKQYTKGEYEELLLKIRKHMDEMPYVDKQGRVYKYGEFFPPELSAYAYNESVALTWYPKTKREALAEGFRWQEPSERSYKVTMKPQDLPGHIRDAGEQLIQETIGCLHDGKCEHQCTTAFRLTPQELGFYKEMNLALPRLCPNCRFWERFAWRNPYDTYDRRCMCRGAAGATTTNGKHSYANTSTHFHGSGECLNEFKTTYAPERQEMIYCEKCYKAEFL